MCVPESVFLATVAGMSILGGFGMTIAMAKRKDPHMFVKVRVPLFILHSYIKCALSFTLCWSFIFIIFLPPLTMWSARCARFSRQQNDESIFLLGRSGREVRNERSAWLLSMVVQAGLVACPSGCLASNDVYVCVVCVKIKERRSSYIMDWALGLRRESHLMQDYMISLMFKLCLIKSCLKYYILGWEVA